MYHPLPHKKEAPTKLSLTCRRIPGRGLEPQATVAIMCMIPKGSLEAAHLPLKCYGPIDVT